METRGAGSGIKGIQPTYEELKPPSLVAVTSIFQCIQPTYEELKPTSRQN